MLNRKLLYRLFSIAAATVFLLAIASMSIAQDDEGAVTDDVAAEVVAAEEVDSSTVTAMMSDVEALQFNLDWTWLALAGFLVFFMQAGFAMLEGGFIRHTGVVNSLAENFMDACVTAIVFFVVGFGLAYGNTLHGTPDGGYGTALFMLDSYDGVGATNPSIFLDFFFQFAFAGAAATIATGAMAERTDFRGKLIYSAILGAVLYPVVVHWTWGGGMIANMSIGDAVYSDFAGSAIVHTTGAVAAL
ncbi:MAG: hypothetical protein ACPG7F_03310, partial [Aggregatilineales bacterium]